MTTALHQIPGKGVREGYFWMLVGADDVVKPDRQVLRWLSDHDVLTDVAGARDVLAQIANQLSERRGVAVTPWQVDNAIWRSITRSTARY